MLRLSIKELASALRSGRISATELCEQCQSRVITLQKLNAIVTNTYDDAKQHAEESTRRLANGTPGHILEGIPFAVKDNFSTKGVETTCASRILQGYKPPYTATVVERLQNDGAVLLGKTNLDEFAMGVGTVDSIFGPTRNPWKYPFQSLQVKGHDSCTSEVKDSDWYIAGGSSGGSAVAVATGMVVGALGSDTGGSVRLPSAFCGVVGLKPTNGLCSRHGLIPLVNTMDVPGIITKTVDDAAIMLGSIAGEDIMDATTFPYPNKSYVLPDDIDVTGLKIGIPQEYHTLELQTDILHMWSKVADIFENAGAIVIPVSLPHTKYSQACYSVLCAVEVASNMSRYDGIEYGHRSPVTSSTDELYTTSRQEGFNDVVKGRIFAGNYFALRRNYDDFFIHAQKVRRLISDDFVKVFNSGIDVLITPVTIQDGFRYEEFLDADNRSRCEELDAFTLTNLAGIPSVTIPTYLSSQGLPMGLQLMAAPFRDKPLLTVAKWLEQQVMFPRHELFEKIEALEASNL